MATLSHIEPSHALLRFPGKRSMLEDGVPSSLCLALFVPASPFWGSSFSQPSAED